MGKRILLVFNHEIHSYSVLHYCMVYAKFFYIHLDVCCWFLMLWHRQAILIERWQVFFLCWIQDSKLGSLRRQITSRLNAHSQTDWAIEDQVNFNSTTRPNDEWAFNPLDFTVYRLSHLALAIYMFVAVNFDTHTHHIYHTHTHRC